MNITIIKRILNYTKSYNKYILIAFISAVINISLTLLTPILIGRAVDLIIGKNNVDFNKLVNILILLLVTIIFSSLFQLIMTRCTNKLVIKLLRT